MGDEYQYIKITNDLEFGLESDVISFAIKPKELKSIIEICERNNLVLVLDYRE